MGVARNTVKAALASDRPPKYQRVSMGSNVDAAAAGPGVARRVSEDAGVGDRRVDRLAVFNPHAQRAGARVAAGVLLSQATHNLRNFWEQSTSIRLVGFPL